MSDGNSLAPRIGGMPLGPAGETPDMATKKAPSKAAKNASKKASTKTPARSRAKKSAAVKKKASPTTAAADEPSTAGTPHRGTAAKRTAPKEAKRKSPSPRKKGKTNDMPSRDVPEPTVTGDGRLGELAKEPAERVTRSKGTAASGSAERGTKALQGSRLKDELSGQRTETTAEYPSINEEPEFKLPLHEKGKAYVPHRDPRPNELHRGQTAASGASHDRPGSQPERVKHQYPNGNKPNAGSARSAQYKGQRRGTDSSAE
ncbi:MAG: hypothetical protein ACO1NQ_00610 [Flavobacteriales bacterium]